MRILYFTDVHLRGNNPEGRLDDYPAAIMDKLRQIGKIIGDNHVDVVICGGDLIDKPNVAYSVVGDMAAAMRAWGCEVLYDIGNHEIFGQNPETIRSSALWPLFGAGLLVLIQPGEVVHYAGSKRVQIEATHFSHLIDKGDLGHYCPARHEATAVMVHVIHGMLVDEPWPQVPHTLVEHLAAVSPADIILSGHEHIGYGIKRISNKLFINPGALCRNTRSLAEMTRQVCVALVEIDPYTGSFDGRLIPLNVAPGDKVLDRGALIAEKQQQRLLEEYAASLEAASAGATMDFEPKLEKLAAAIGAGEEVKADVRTRYEKAQQRLANTDASRK